MSSSLGHAWYAETRLSTTTTTATTLSSPPLRRAVFVLTLQATPQEFNGRAEIRAGIEGSEGRGEGKAAVAMERWGR